MPAWIEVDVSRIFLVDLKACLFQKRSMMSTMVDNMVFIFLRCSWNVWPKRR